MKFDNVPFFIPHIVINESHFFSVFPTNDSDFIFVSDQIYFSKFVHFNWTLANADYCLSKKKWFSVQANTIRHIIYKNMNYIRKSCYLIMCFAFAFDCFNIYCEIIAIFITEHSLLFQYGKYEWNPYIPKYLNIVILKQCHYNLWCYFITLKLP